MGKLVGILHFNYFYSKLIKIIFRRSSSQYIILILNLNKIK